MLWDRVATGLDRLVIESMVRRMPASFQESFAEAPDFEEVLAATAIDHAATPAYSVLAPGERPVHIRSCGESLRSIVNVRLMAGPEAPLVLFHHGFSQRPYTSSWRRIFRLPFPTPVNTVLIKAPFHSHWREPFQEAFKSFRRVYQTFASSLRMMELVQAQFETAGASFTVVSGVSWGGITSMLYAGLFGGVRAVVPLLSGPNVAQVIWDGAELCNVDVPVSKRELEDRLDFRPYIRRTDPERIFPLLGENDLFFPPERHDGQFWRAPVIVDRAHVFSPDGEESLRTHLLEVLAWAERNPLASE